MKNKKDLLASTAIIASTTLLFGRELYPFCCTIAVNYALNLTCKILAKDKAISPKTAKLFGAFYSAYIFANCHRHLYDYMLDGAKALDYEVTNQVFDFFGHKAILMSYTVGAEPSLILKSTDAVIQTLLNPGATSSSSGFPILEAGLAQYFGQLIKHHLSPAGLVFEMNADWTQRFGAGFAGYCLYSVVACRSNLLSKEGMGKLVLEGSLGGTKHILTGLLGLYAPGGFHNPSFIIGYGIINAIIEELRYTSAAKYLEQSFQDRVKADAIAVDTVKKVN